MENNSARRKKRKIFFLLFVILVTTLTLVVETYAWFVGMSSVSTSNFSVNVQAEDGLALSLDATNWQTSSLTISEATVAPSASPNVPYSGHKNKWTSGLAPVSTVGAMNASSSNLTLYEKTSLSATAGGYRLMASAVSNSSAEQDGYIAFDLFIRNGQGTTYLASSYDINSEEDVYLTASSAITSNLNGAVNNGVAYSARVGFFEIARVSTADAASTPSTITGATCGSTATGVTTLCNSDSNTDDLGATWNIWEPNDLVHTAGAISYFNTVCKKRNDADTYSTTACDAFTASSYVNTYSINSAIVANDKVDIYDGLNTYTSSAKLSQVVTYKAADISNNTNSKKSLIKLAANSVTKVRVYIWLEGQDVDNYDLITNDLGINVTFGFTKNKFGLSNS